MLTRASYCRRSKMHTEMYWNQELSENFFFSSKKCWVKAVKMKIPINKLIKIIRSTPQWSITMTVTVCLYFLFTMLVLTISFPLKSHKIKSEATENERENFIGLLNDDDGLGLNEQKILQRARDLPTVNNRTDVLRDAFKK